MESSMEAPKKLKTELPYDPVIPLLDINPKELKTVPWRDICSIIHNSQEVETT